MPSAMDTLRQRYGGVPLYVWGGGAVLLGAGFIVWRKRGKAVAPAQQSGMSPYDQYLSDQQGSDSGSGGGGGGGMDLSPLAELLQSSNSKLEQLLSQQQATTQQPQPTPAKSASTQPNLLPVTSLSDYPSVYGALPQNAPYSYSDFPKTTSGVQAPAGGQFLYGQWEGDSLTHATYQLPSGQFVSV